MVWGLFPVDPLPGEEKYYFFSKGTYTVGRKGCDIIVNKDKGVSRVHAEIVIDDMINLHCPEKVSSNTSSRVRIRDCSKYGTFINKNLGSKEKVHDFPNKETVLKDGDMVSFGTGTATYRFSFVPFIFYICSGGPSEKNRLFKEKISFIGACVAPEWSLLCTHVVVSDSTSLDNHLIDAVVARKPFVQYSWIEFIAGKAICTEIPSFTSYAPKLILEGVSVDVVDPHSRENCLRGCTFIVESRDKYKFKDRLQALLEAAGAKVVSVEDFSQDTQGFGEGGNNRVLRVVPHGLTSNSGCFRNLSFSLVNETDVISAVLSGHLDPSVIMSAPVLVTSSCSTEETVVADSDAETESATSDHKSAAVYSLESTDPRSKPEIEIQVLDSAENDNKEESGIHMMECTDYGKRDAPANIQTHTESLDKLKAPDDYAAVNLSQSGQVSGFKDKDGGAMAKTVKTETSETRNLDIIYSQDLIVRDSKLPSSVHSDFATGNTVLNFKRFRKINTPSGNSFDSLIPYSKYPYEESDYGNEEVNESVKEEKRRKQMEAIAEDLFNSEKKRKRGTAGSLHGLFGRT